MHDFADECHYSTYNYVLILCLFVTCAHVVDTTDILKVSVTMMDEDSDAIRLNIQCHFITGSNAQGCMVVVTLTTGSRHDNHTMIFNLTRDENTASYTDIRSASTVHLLHYCYDEAVVLAYDIEEDGSIGTVAVPGAFIFNVDTHQVRSCLSQTEPSKHTSKANVLFLQYI